MYNCTMPMQNQGSPYNNPYDVSRAYQPIQQPMSLTRVTGIEGAKAFQMPPNSVTALFDNNDDLFFVKTTDGAGFPTIRTFRFTEENIAPIPNQSEYVTRSEIDVMKKEIHDYVEQSIQSTTGKSVNATSKSNKTE